MQADATFCPHCGTAGLRRVGAGSMALASFAAAGCLLWIPVIGWVLAPVLFVMAIVYGASGLLPSGTVSFYCSACKRWSRKTKAELQE